MVMNVDTNPFDARYFLIAPKALMDIRKAPNYYLCSEHVPQKAQHRRGRRGNGGEIRLLCTSKINCCIKCENNGDRQTNSECKKPGERGSGMMVVQLNHNPSSHRVWKTKAKLLLCLSFSLEVLNCAFITQIRWIPASSLPF